MHPLSILSVALGFILSQTNALPTPSGTQPNNIFSPVVSGVTADASDAASILSAVLEAVEDAVTAQLNPTPTDIPSVTSVLSSVFSSTPTNIYDNVIQLIDGGISPTPEELENLLVGSIAPENSENNVNLKNPVTSIFPKKSPADAPYTLSEADLRKVIYIPETFTYGQKPPVILVPGTGNTGYQTFVGNYIPLLTNVPYADIVWLNIPIQLLGDAQVNAEYVAYAINYINGITSQNATVISWSQGGLDAQWAFKYWPSTRSSTTQLIANSPDFHGTVIAYAACPSFPELPCPPAIIQQEYNSNFIRTLRANGGDSAYVPTTTIFSATDEIVEPQSPVQSASAFLLDARQVGVTNNQVQAICGGKGPAGTAYTHEGVLYNPLGYALTIDALKNARPGQVADLDLDVVCVEIVSPGLDVTDVLITENAITIAAISILLYPYKVLTEPAIKQYALQGTSGSVSTSGSGDRNITKSRWQSGSDASQARETSSQSGGGNGGDQY